MFNRIARREEGFTLIELLVVILIIGILIAIAAPSFLGQQNKAHDSKAEQTLNTAYKNAKAYAVEFEGQYSGGVNAVAAALTAAEPGLNVVTAAAPATDQLQVSAATGQQLDLRYKSKSGTTCQLTVSTTGVLTSGDPQC